ncbi:MAG: response regulator [Planctomycetota bacterium]|nr:response regulator [Planctomycetota bacterium]
MNAARARTVLVCDDEAPIRQVIAHKLRAHGYVVHEARTGQEGVDAVLGGLSPDLILSDLQMPVMSGLEMCRVLREMAPTRETPALMLTARGYIIAPEDLEHTNIRQVIAKPFGVKQLVDRVRALLGPDRAPGDPSALAA